jgi:hypothetical protein
MIKADLATQNNGKQWRNVGPDRENSWLNVFPMMENPGGSVLGLIGHLHHAKPG